MCSTLTENFEALLFGNFIVESDGNSQYLLFLWPFLRSFSCKIHKEDRASKRQPVCRSALCGYDVFFIGGLRSLATVFSGEVFRHSWKAFSHQQSFVYSDYARQGFFELCFISVINFGLFYFIKVFSDREKKTVKLMLSYCGDSRIYYACFFQNVPLY